MGCIYVSPSLPEVAIQAVAPPGAYCSREVSLYLKAERLLPDQVSHSLHYSFYRVNEVQRFEYSRPIRKGEKNPDNEFAVKIPSSFPSTPLEDHQMCLGIVWPQQPQQSMVSAQTPSKSTWGVCICEMLSFLYPSTAKHLSP